MASQAITALEYEETLNWFYEEGLDCGIQLKATCAPHYFRIFHQRKKERPGAPAHVPPAGGGAHPLHTMSRGCLGGISFCFISHTGQVQPCGYLELDCGQLTKQSFPEAWNNVQGLLRHPRPEPVRGKVRPLRVHPGLRRLPRAGLRGDGELPGGGAVVHLRTEGSKR